MKYITCSLLLVLCACTSLPKPPSVEGVQKVPVNQFTSFTATQ